MTYQFAAGLLRSSGTGLREVRITRLTDGVFYARPSSATAPRSWSPPACSASSPKLQELDRVVLEDLGTDAGLDLQGVEVLQPSLRGQQREIGAEQHLVLQVGVGRADEGGREILRRP